MPTTEAGLWRSIERELEVRVPAMVRDFCRRGGWVTDYLHEDEDLEGARERLIEVLRALQGSGLWEEPEEETVDVTPGGDERWELLRDLELVKQETKLGHQPAAEWSPMHLSRVFHPLSVASPERVQITIDNRLALRAVIDELRRAWPLLLQSGWVRRTRPLNKRTVALVRFVCLESPTDATWRQRLEQWNEQYTEWEYPDVRPFQSAFRRAERELSGKPYGLEWFYNPVAQLDAHERSQKIRSGDRAAREYRRRKSRELFQSIGKFTSRLEEQGLHPEQQLSRLVAVLNVRMSQLESDKEGERV